MGSLSALVAGFVMVAFVQFNFDPGGVPLPVLLGFGITNALTVGTTAEDVLQEWECGGQRGGTICCCLCLA